VDDELEQFRSFCARSGLMLSLWATDEVDFGGFGRNWLSLVAGDDNRPTSCP
jgi:hypothetical protein